MRTAIALTAVLCALALAPAAPAATWTVETTGDGAGDCVMPAGTCTLRAAIVAAGPGDTILLGPGTYDNTGNDFTVGIDEHVRIVGAGARATTVREVSGGDGRVFLVEQRARLELTSLTVTGSRDNAGVLLFGGDNSLSAARVAFRGNSGAAEGGAIDGTGGAVTLAESTVSGNSATGSGGGIHADGAAGSLALVNSTVSGNSAPSGSGIAVAAGQATLTRATLAGNTGSPDLALGAAPAVARLAGTIVGGCSGGAPVSLGFNLEPGASCALAGAGDRQNANPLLGPLADNGGETDTLVPAPGSPAVDAGGGCPAADQRGVARPQGAACDVGAVELEQAPAPPAAAVLTRLRIRRVSRRAFRVSYRLDRPAKVRFALRRCARPPRGCSRSRRLRAFSKRGDAGANAFRLRARGLRRARHRLVARPAGGAPVRRAFHVRRFRP